MGVDLGEHRLSLLLDDLNRVSAGGPAQRRFVLAGEVDQRVGELGGVAALRAIHSLPRGDRLPGALGVVINGRFRPDGGVAAVPQPGHPGRHAPAHLDLNPVQDVTKKCRPHSDLATLYAPAEAELATGNRS